MDAIEVKPGIYWVGAIDWNLRNFHGYLTPRGTSYNAYLVVDEKVALIDTVKAPFVGEMFQRIATVLDPSKIDYVICNHVEMDHSGGIPEVVRRTGAKVLTSPQGKKGLIRHYGEDLPYEIVKTGSTLELGQRTLSFVQTPMVHWPDSMVVYSAQDKILFPNDAFGQHISCPERFDDQLGFSFALEEAAKYYANIVLCYSAQVKKALEAVSSLDFDMIAPSHGVIWRSQVQEIVAAYQEWAAGKTDRRAVIIYDTMWSSTEKIARALQGEFEKQGVRAVLLSLQHTHISDVMTEVLRARIVAVGSPTLNSTVLPTVGGFLTYLKGLRPTNRVGFAFGSYGWSNVAIKEIQNWLEEMKMTLPVGPFALQYIPRNEELTELSATVDTLLEAAQD